MDVRTLEAAIAVSFFGMINKYAKEEMKSYFS